MKRFENEISCTNTTNGLDFLMTALRIALEDHEISKKEYLVLMAKALNKKVSIAE